MTKKHLQFVCGFLWSWWSDPSATTRRLLEDWDARISRHWMLPISGQRRTITETKLQTPCLRHYQETWRGSFCLFNLSTVRKCRKVWNLIIDKITSRLEWRWVAGDDCRISRGVCLNQRESLLEMEKEMERGIEKETERRRQRER